MPLRHVCCWCSTFLLGRFFHWFIHFQLALDTIFTAELMWHCRFYPNGRILTMIIYKNHYKSRFLSVELLLLLLLLDFLFYCWNTAFCAYKSMNTTHTTIEHNISYIFSDTPSNACTQSLRASKNPWTTLRYTFQTFNPPTNFWTPQKMIFNIIVTPKRDRT